MARPKIKRPLMTKEDRDRLATMALAAGRRIEADQSTNRAYAQGVKDVLLWLCGNDMSALLEEVSR